MWKRERYAAALDVASDVEKLVMSSSPQPWQPTSDVTAKIFHVVELWLRSVNSFERAVCRVAFSNSSSSSRTTLPVLPRTRVSLLSSTVEMILSFGLMSSSQQLPLLAAIAPPEVPPDATTMYRWTSIVLWLLQSLTTTAATCPPEAVRLAITAAHAARIICPLGGAALMERIAGANTKDLLSRGVSGWSPLHVAIAQCRVAALADNNRVSFQHFDSQVANDYVLKLLTRNVNAVEHPSTVTGAQQAPSCKTIPVSSTLEPLIRYVAPSTQSSMFAEDSHNACGVVAAYITEVLFQALSSFTWRFSSGWLAAAILAANAEQCLSSALTLNEGDHTGGGLALNAYSVLELFTAKIMDQLCRHMSTATDTAFQNCKERDVHPWKVHSGSESAALVPVVREVLMAFLVYVWEPIASCFVNVITPTEGSHALLETISCSCVSMFAFELVSMAKDHRGDDGGSPFSSSPMVAAVSRLAAAANGLNTLQRVVAEDERVSVGLRTVVLEILAASR